MSLADRMRATLSGETGGVMVFVVVILPVLLLFAAFVLDVGNWFEHKRHLQVQADAAALAGGDLFGECFSNPSAAYADMQNMAASYGGDTSTAYNQQVGNTNKGSIAVRFNSTTFANGTTWPGDDTVVGSPCNPPYMFDVKETESNLPFFFGGFVPGFGTLPAINARARVSLKQVISGRGGLPLAVPDVNPKQVDVTFVDESTGAELSGCSGAALVPGTTCSFFLTKGSPSNNLNIWSASGSVAIPSAPKTIGMRVGLGGQVASCGGGSNGGANFVCYDYNTASGGVVGIRDYSVGGSGNPPVLNGVWPMSACSGSEFFSDASTNQSTCSVGVQAEVNMGTGSTNPATGTAKAELNATINGTKVPMSPVSYDSSTSSWLWSTSGYPVGIPVSAASGTSAYPITLDWAEHGGTEGGNTCTTQNNNKCKGSFGTVGRLVSANDSDDGPVKIVQLTESGAPMSPWSLRPGSHTLSITVGLKGNLAIVTPPQLTALRLTGGSRTSGVNCDGSGNSTFTNSIVNGCTTPYQVNTNDLCPDPSPPPGPADCVPLKTGNLGTTVARALDQRFAACPPDNWPNYQVGDPRITQLMLTDYSALGGNGKTTVPVTNFALFYIVGWSGNKCGNPWPFPFAEPNGGNIWGYFIKGVATSDTGGTTICDPLSIDPCVAVLTK
jgi:Flp pilus assembly protein TadG